MNIAIVTPWRDHLELADDYFEAVLPEMEEGDELLVVDNASAPPLAFAHLRLERNRGYCGGSNAGLRYATTEAVLLLNNDIAHTRRGWLAELRAELEPGVLVGPLRDHTHARVPGVRESLEYIDGWCLAGMREELLELGGLDESLAEPAYFSDNLLCLEARVAGMALREVEPGLLHKENATAGPPADARVREATAVNRDRYRARVRELLVAT